MLDKKKRIDVRHPERSLLTDTIPFELPLFYTNANFAILAHLDRAGSNAHQLHSRYLLTKSSDQPTKPYPFKILRDARSHRRLQLAHPRSQHLMSQFYAQHELFICNACGRSDYSLRYPSRVATRYVDPKYASQAVQSGSSQADEDPVGFRDQSKWASTYFSYRNYNLSYKFFESEEFLQLEKRFSLLRKLDVSRCFDSIYTHSIEWSMRGKSFSKRHLPNKSRTTFESSFDTVIRHANWNETHGIIVGPEFSRVFAEVLMQSADRSIKSKIAALRPDVEIRRYVDDYFVFSSDTAMLDRVEDCIKEALSELNLHLNEGKTSTIARPFTSKLSAARRKVSAVLDEFSEVAEPLFFGVETHPTPRMIENARKGAIATLRRIAVELEISYSQFASFSLTILNRHVADISLRLKTEVPDLTGGHLPRLSWLTSVIRIAQFLFAIDQRVTTSVKLAGIYASTLDLAKTVNCAIGPLEGQILDGLRHGGTDALAPGTDEIARINLVCTVDLLLTGPRRLEVEDLRQHLGYRDGEGALSDRSIFQLTCLLFISRRRHRFRKVLAATTDEIEARISQGHVRFDHDAESAYLLTDYISCPYIESGRKQKIIQQMVKRITGKNCTSDEARMVSEESSWISFTDWSGTSDLRSMLARKELTPAYE